MKYIGFSLMLFSLFLNCEKAHPVSQAYFLLPFFRAGGTRPTTPTNLVARYNVTLETFFLTWNGSLDPDTNQPNVQYTIYFYNVPPIEYYRIQDVLDTTPLTSYFIQASPFTGQVYFVVTASDGSAESLPSNVAPMEIVY